MLELLCGRVHVVDARAERRKDLVALGERLLELLELLRVERDLRAQALLDGDEVVDLDEVCLLYTSDAADEL